MKIYSYYGNSSVTFTNIDFPSFGIQYASDESYGGYGNSQATGEMLTDTIRDFGVQIRKFYGTYQASYFTVCVGEKGSFTKNQFLFF